jgi:hypothetical protein
MSRAIAMILPLLLVAGCAGGSDNAQIAENSTEAEQVESTEPPATESETTTAVSAAGSEPATTVTSTLPDTVPTTEAAVVEGAESSEDAVSEWYEGIAERNLSRMWSMLDPELKVGVSRPAWETCITEQLNDTVTIDSISYDENETYTEGDSTFSTGTGTLTSGDLSDTSAITFQVVEREGGWFAVGPAASTNDSCLTQQSAPETGAPTTEVVQGGELAEASGPDASAFVGSFGDTTLLDLPAGDSGEVTVIAQTAGLDGSGSLPIVVRNNTESTVYQIDVTGRARVDGTLAATGSSQGFEPAVVEPGEIAFGYVYFDYDADLQGAEYELAVTAESDTSFKLPAVIDEVSATGDAIVGVVANTGSVEITGPVAVAVACFDGSGAFAGHAFSFTNEDDIAPDGGTASFRVDLYDDAVACEIGLVAASGFDF